MPRLVALTLLAALPLRADLDNAWKLVRERPDDEYIHLNGVWGSSSSDVFAVGGNGMILHYDGDAWTGMTSGTDRDLYGIWGASSDNVYAVGARDTVLHYDGDSWSALDPPGYAINYCVWGSSSSNILVGGSTGIRRFNGSTWDTLLAFSPGASSIRGICGNSDTNVYAINPGGSTGIGRVLHYDGHDWDEVYQHWTWLTDVWVSPAGKVWAAGHGGDVAHYDGHDWSTMEFGNEDTLWSIWGASATDIFVGGSRGVVAHYNGVEWTEMVSGTSTRLYGFWGSSAADVWACTTWGQILHYEDENRELTGTWATATISGSGTYNPATQQPNGGTIYITVNVLGDIVGTFNYVADFYAPDDKWYGTSAKVVGSVTVDGEEHEGELWLKGDIVEFNLFQVTPLPPTWGWSCELNADIGETHAYTTDGSDLSADFGWSGNCSGAALITGATTWQLAGGSGSGTWNGIASECLSGKTEFAGSGTGVVSVASTESSITLAGDVAPIATLEYDFDYEDAEVIIARYVQNPGENPERPTLHKFVQVDTSATEPDIAWDEITLKLYYTDVEAGVAGIDEETFEMYRWNGLFWDVVPVCGVNTESNYVWAALEDFGVYSAQGWPTFITCDSGGNPRDSFGVGETVYVTGAGLSPSNTYRLWIQRAPVDETDELLDTADPSGAQELVQADAVGRFAVTSVGALALDAEGAYQVVADSQDFGGMTNFFDQATDRAGAFSARGISTLFLVK